MTGSESKAPRLLYSLDRELTYHLVTLVLLGLAIVVTGLATLLTPEAVHQDFGTAAPHRYMQGGFLLVAWSPLVAWLWFVRRYVRRIVWLPDDEVVELQRCGYLSRKTWRVPVSAFLRATAHDGHLELPGVPVVDAPYQRLHLAGLPTLILDEQGTTHDPDALEAIFEGRKPPPAPISRRRSQR